MSNKLNFEKQFNMDGLEYLKLHNQLCVLKEVAEKYSGKTIDSVIEDIDSKIKEADKQWE